MEYVVFRFFTRYVFGPVVTVLLILILLASILIWEKVKTRWQDWKLSRGKGS